MMFDRMTHPTLLMLVQNTIVVLAVAFAIYLCGSPMPLFALLLLAPLPVLSMGGHPMQGDEGEFDDDRNRDPEIGFTARLRETPA